MRLRTRSTRYSTRNRSTIIFLQFLNEQISGEGRLSARAFARLWLILKFVYRDLAFMLPSVETPWEKFICKNIEFSIDVFSKIFWSFTKLFFGKSKRTKYLNGYRLFDTIFAHKFVQLQKKNSWTLVASKSNWIQWNSQSMINQKTFNSIRDCSKKSNDFERTRDKFLSTETRVVMRIGNELFLIPGWKKVHRKHILWKNKSTAITIRAHTYFVRSCTFKIIEEWRFLERSN